MAGAPASPLLIAGAGVAGLAAAVALARRGFAVTLIERATRFEEIGAGVQLSPNASRALIALGLGPAAARASTAPTGLDVRRLDRDRILAAMPMDDSRFGAPFWTLLRADLQTLLIDAVRGEPRVRLLVGRTLEAVASTDAGVEATVATGSGAHETIAGSALIGADGLWSRARTLLGETADPRPAGFEAWRALVPAEAAPAFARAPRVGLWMGRPAHLVHYPVQGGRLINLVLVRAVESGAAREAGWNAPADGADLAPLMGRMASPARALVSAASGWRVWPLHDLAPLTRIAKGPVVLVGDAAHPVLPFMAQGAGLAIEDAVALADEAARSPDDLIRAFQRYAGRRRARTAKAQAAARAAGRAYHAGGVTAWGRDRMLAAMGEKGMLRRYDWLYRWTPDSPA